VLEEEEESWTSKGGAPYASKHSFFCTCAVERDGSGVGGVGGGGGGGGGAKRVNEPERQGREGRRKRMKE